MSASIEILVCVQEQSNGGALVFPAARPDWAVFDFDDDWHDELRKAVGALLRREPAETIAALALWRGVLIEVPVKLELRRRELDRLGDLVGLYPCLVSEEIGDGQGRWVTVLGFEHGFWLAATDQVEPVAIAEIQRLLDFRLLSGVNPLVLLPPERTRLEMLEIVVRDPPRNKKAAKKRGADLELLADVGRRLPVDPRLVGWQERPEVERLRRVLLGGQRFSAVVVGPAGSGKSTLITQALVGRDHVYATSGFLWVAGQALFGQLEERARAILEAAARLDAILYFESFDELLTSLEGSSNLLGLIRPFLERRQVRLVCELSSEAEDEAERRFPSFFSLLEKVRLAPLAAPATRAALQARIAHERARDQAPLPATLLVEPILEISARYYPDTAWPGRPLGLLQELLALDFPADLAEIGAPELYVHVARKTGIPEFLLREDVALRRDTLRQAFRAALVGQEAAIERLVSTLCAVKARLQPEGKPLAFLLFVGPTGVGKTEAARCLARLLFADEERLIRFDMSEFAESGAADRLIRGNDREDGLLTRRVRREPFGVILLDEIEKADHGVFDLLLQVAGEGRLSDARGRTVSFHNTILILTSNLGAQKVKKNAIGFDPNQGPAALDTLYREQVRSFFRPEMVNRFDAIVVFRPLLRAEIATIARQMLGHIGRRRGLEERGLRLLITPELIDVFAAAGDTPEHGARRLRRHLQQELVAGVAGAIAGAGNAALGVDLVVREGTNGALDLRFERREGGARPEDALAPFLALRRLLGRLLASGTLTQLASALHSTRLELGAVDRRLQKREKTKRGRGAQRDTRPLTELKTQLLLRYRRLDTVNEPLEALLQELEDVEEVALAAWLGHGDFAALLEPLPTWREQARVGLVRALLAPEEHSTLVLLLSEGDEFRALDFWLRPWLERDQARAPSCHAWPIELADPPFPAETALDAHGLAAWLERPKRGRHLILEVESTDSGAFSFEVGWHRFVPSGRSAEAAHLHVRRAQKGATTDSLRRAIASRIERFPLTEAQRGRLSFLRDWEVNNSWLWPQVPVRRKRDAVDEWLEAVDWQPHPLPVADYWRRIELVLAPQLLRYELDETLDRERDLETFLSFPRPK